MSCFDPQPNAIRRHYKTIVISDVHLGTAGCKAKEIVRFLKHNTCDTLVMNGDIIDAWELKNYGKWKVAHTRFFKVVIKMMEEFNTKVIYLHGNHDDFLDNILPIQIGNLSIQMDYIHESFGKRYYIVHGDIFDSVTSHMKWVAKLGSIGYTFLLWLNKGFNAIRRLFGKPPYSFSQYIKSKVKSAVSPVAVYERQLTELAGIKNCTAILCGHTHKPAIKQIDEILYMNSGDWVESMTALTEDFNGNWQLIHYKDLPEATRNLSLTMEQALDEEAEIDKMEAFYFANIFATKMV
jgi:UDP-2,3-diacylglucosamine pyrophosphatase LpxH